MSQRFLGEKFFTARERIEDLRAKVSHLAKRTATNAAVDGAEAEHESNLLLPFTILILGEVNAGKSSLLNSLAGTEICPANTLPTTKNFVRYEFAENETQQKLPHNTILHKLPQDFLKNFHMIDTPGANSPEGDQIHIIRDLAQNASVVLVTFQITNPWISATWNQISALPPETHDKLAIVLQKSDLLGPADTAIVLEHLRDLSIKKLGFVPKTFPVSAKLEDQTRQTSSQHPQSGFFDLTEYISSHICNSPKRQRILKDATQNISDTLHQIENQIDKQRSALSSQNDFLASMENEINRMRDDLTISLPDHLEKIALNFKTQTKDVIRSLRKHLNLPRSILRIFMGDRTSTTIEHLFIKHLQSAVETVAGSDAENAVATCEQHWKTLIQRVHREMGLELHGEPRIRSYLAQSQQHFVHRLTRAAHTAVGDLHVRKDLENNLKKRNLALKSFTSAVLLSLCVAAIGGILETTWIPEITLLLAAFFALTGTFVGIATRAKITREFKQTLLAACTSFASTLRNDYEDALRMIFQQYATCLDPIRHHLADQRLNLEPNLQQWHNMFLTLKTIEQDL